MEQQGEEQANVCSFFFCQSKEGIVKLVCEHANIFIADHNLGEGQ